MEIVAQKVLWSLIFDYHCRYRKYVHQKHLRKMLQLFSFFFGVGNLVVGSIITLISYDMRPFLHVQGELVLAVQPLDTII